MGQVATVWGLDINGWTAVMAIATAVLAVATVILAGATIALIIVGRSQIVAAREEAKRNRTLAAAERYDTDPILDACLRRLSEARRSRDIHFNTRQYRVDLMTVCNYMEAIAIGVDRELYDPNMIRDHLESIFTAHYEEYFKSDIATKADMDPDDFTLCRKLCETWIAEKTMPGPKI